MNDETTAADELGEKKMDELVAIADELGIDHQGVRKKDDMVALIEAAREDAANAAADAPNADEASASATALGLPPADASPAAAGDLTAQQAREFPTAWHRDAYIDGLRREIEGARVRQDDVQLGNAQRELDRVLGDGKQTRPRGAGKQTR
jgi:hypothetical protein